MLSDDKYTVGRQMDIQMDIKPRSSSGLLLSIHGRNDHVVLEMVNGTIKFLVKAAKGQIETSYDAASPNSLCDGNWHNIRGTINFYFYQYTKLT
jgi:laminin alpha 3/5